MKIDLIAGARPNFMKIAPIIDAIEKAKTSGKEIEFRLIHTGQHFDKNMSGNFFDQLGIPKPDINLGARGGTQSEQTAAIMIEYEKLLSKEKPDLCLVVGDVTSTLACAITAQKLHVKVAHVEGGIRSGDWSMPEEINRLVTDSITNYFFTTTSIADENLLKSGVSQERIFRVGNTMIDTLIKYRKYFHKPLFWDKLKLEKKKYIVLTLHRPANVDQEQQLKALLEAIVDSTDGLPIIFPIHPRTAKTINKLYDIASLNEIASTDKSFIKKQPLPKSLYIVQPLGYMEFNFLVEHSCAVITDSGGITEETTVLGIPCITLRDNTERPETINIGTNELVGTDPKGIKPAIDKLLFNKWKKGSIPELWDGKAAERIVEKLLEIF